MGLGAFAQLDRGGTRNEDSFVGVVIRIGEQISFGHFDGWEGEAAGAFWPARGEGHGEDVFRGARGGSHGQAGDQAGGIGFDPGTWGRIVGSREGFEISCGVFETGHASHGGCLLGDALCSGAVVAGDGMPCGLGHFEVSAGFERGGSGAVPGGASVFGDGVADHAEMGS
ncbi:MAG: hypothetical protein U1E22_03175 [Coriobacteriia bacterium]|nr:hypothetical protein [Coriobacteriia bacterium]